MRVRTMTDLEFDGCWLCDDDGLVEVACDGNGLLCPVCERVMVEPVSPMGSQEEPDA